MSCRRKKQSFMELSERAGKRFVGVAENGGFGKFTKKANFKREKGELTEY